ncbi:Bax inhibitor-1/YccA family protein [Flavobacterium aciduliphilum]|uniref:Putative YccA/Bax inhibitor family protein n=1 Tax=Flavobacterium aciduliphilum TaxID=1101402 RepID=A0A328YBM5_9FLAO|nr:Bax inhibitor-1/YccA family protein [Flavobacterium aciduliphilum]RAR71378.1 putative YccA/Bax inhibitor family protein [Flavobacterium aciduliphilum]
MNSKNPFFKTDSFKNATTTHEAVVIDYQDTMTVSGTINKSVLLLFLLVASAFATWNMAINGQNPTILMIGGAIAGLVFVLITTFKPQLSSYLSPAYAVAEGLFIGGLSAIFEVRYPGIVMQAVGGTFATFFACFMLYKYKVVTVNDKFRSIVIAVTAAIAIYYLCSWILTFFISYQPVHYGNSLISIGISLFVIVIAALNLFLDFDQIERGAAQRAPKYMEWYGAMGLMITLVWLYVEFLRLLSKLSSRK